ncbi:unnamed protein product [Owenia fusiformis]|uniref:Uncharacterized protein n=1 Tax=Owenia fusiformis TaxID=6347 RepID=A0A8J1TEZ3_OWEFU|nr:unnamed protein product [Owenia fusiformis]
MEVPAFSTFINDAIVNVALTNITFQRVMNIFGLVTVSLPDEEKLEVIVKIQQTLFKPPDSTALPKSPLLLSSVFQKNFRKVISDMIEKEILNVIITHFAPKSSVTVDSIITITQENLPYIVAKMHRTICFGKPLEEMPKESQDKYYLKNCTANPENRDFICLKLNDISKTKNKVNKGKGKLPADKSEKIQGNVGKKATGRWSCLQDLQRESFNIIPKKSKPNKKRKRDAITEQLDEIFKLDAQGLQGNLSHPDQVKTEIIDHDYTKAYGENVPEADDRIVMKGDDFKVVCEGDSESEDIGLNNESQELCHSNRDENIDQTGHNSNSSDLSTYNVEYENLYQLLHSKTSASSEGTKARKEGTKAKNKSTQARSKRNKARNKGTRVSNGGTTTNNDGAEAVILGTVTKVNKKNGKSLMSFKASKIGTAALNELTDNAERTENQPENKAPEENSTQVQLIKCRDCPEIFKNRNAFLLHAPVCYYNNQYPKLINSKRHHMFHHPINPKRPLISCDICGEIFTDKQDLTNHQEKEKHTGKLEKVVCRYCPRSFSCKSSCSVHERLKHKVYVMGQYKCKYCTQRFHSIGKRRRHEKLYCGKFYEKFTDIQSDPDSDETEMTGTAHNNTSEDGTTYECKYCLKAFHKQGQCEKHEGMHERLQQERVSLNPETGDVTINELDSNDTQMIDSPSALQNKTDSLPNDIHEMNTLDDDAKMSDDDPVTEEELTGISSKKAQSMPDKKKK